MVPRLARDSLEQYRLVSNTSTESFVGAGLDILRICNDVEVLIAVENS